MEGSEKEQRGWEIDHLQGRRREEEEGGELRGRPTVMSQPPKNSPSM